MTRPNVASSPVLLFIYGTLKRGHCRAPLLAEQRFLRSVHTKPIYQLIHCGSYPGLVGAGASDATAIEGELWEVSRDCLASLDHEEGVDVGLYQRAAIEIEGLSQRVEGYLYLHDTTLLADCGDCWTLKLERSVRGD